MTNGRKQDDNFWSMGDTLAKTASPAGSQQFAADAMRALRARDIARAVRSASTAIELEPTNPLANLTLALANEMSGKLADAQRHYAEVLKQTPDSVPALIGLGRLKLNERKGVEALAALTRAVHLEPDNVDARHLLARTYGLLLRFEESVAAFEIVNGKRPNNPEILAGYARALGNAGRTAEALDTYRKAAALNPNDDAVQQGMASILIDIGKSDEAAALLRKAIALKPTRPGPYEQLARLGMLNAAELEAARKHASSPKTAPLDAASFKIAVGTALLRREKYAEAFVFLSEANAERDRERTYDPRRVSAMVEAVKDAMAEVDRPAPGPNVDRPLFIMGMPRSGTTLVEQIFARHSKVFPGGERAVGGEMRRRLQVTHQSFRHALRGLTPEAMEALRRHYFAGLPAAAALAERVTDKLPDNIWNLPLLRKLFPAARILICRRHPLDTCWSIFEQGFGPQVPYASNLGHIANHIAAQDQIIQKWLAEDQGLSREVLYEEVVQRFPESVQALIEFAGLGWEEACLSFTESDRAVRTASATQVRRGIYTSSMGRWRNFAEQLRPQQMFLAQQIEAHEQKLQTLGLSAA
ncbi:MAG: sulfotransferase [Rhizobiales bacterium]|nr:sulfotransferase [Hyphomicrobiales bacterium]